MSSISSLPHSKEPTSLNSRELRSFLRHLRSGLHAHRVYKPNHPMLLKAVSLLHNNAKKLAETYGEIVLHIQDGDLLINDADIRILLDSEQHDEIVQLFGRIEVTQITISHRTTLRDLSRLLSVLFPSHCSSDQVPGPLELRTQVPSLGLLFAQEGDSPSSHDLASASATEDAEIPVPTPPPPGPHEHSLVLDTHSLILDTHSLILDTRRDDPQAVPHEHLLDQDTSRDDNPPPTYSRDDYALLEQQVFSAEPTRPETRNASSQNLSSFSVEELDSPIPSQVREGQSVPYMPQGSTSSWALPSDFSEPTPSAESASLEQLSRSFAHNTPPLPPLLNESWLHSQDAVHYFHQLFAGQRQLSQMLASQSIHTARTLEAPHLQNNILQTYERVLSLLQTFSEPYQHELLYQHISDQLLTLSPVLVNEHLLQLRHNSAHLTLRRELLHQSNAHQIQQLQDTLLLRLEQATNDNVVTELVALMKDLIDSLYLREFEAPLLTLLLRLRDTQTMFRTPLSERWIRELFQHLASSQYLASLFEQARQPGSEQTQQLLAELCEWSVPYGVFQLPRLHNTPQYEEQVALLLLIQFHADPEARSNGLYRVLAELNTLPDIETQELCFSLCRQFAPKLLESYIFQRLPSISSPHLRQRLLLQAVMLNTPKIQTMLKQMLEGHAFLSDPEQEEWLLHHLHRHGVVHALDFLRARLSDPHIDLRIRNGAIWMLGGFPSGDSLAILQDILQRDPPDDISLDAWYTLQFQALHTLTRYPFPDIQPQLEAARHHPALLHQLHARQLLQEPLPSTEQDLQQEIAASQPSPEQLDRQRFLVKLWLALLIGLLLSMGTLVTLYLSGWLGKLLSP